MQHSTKPYGVSLEMSLRIKPSDKHFDTAMEVLSFRDLPRLKRVDDASAVCSVEKLEKDRVKSHGKCVFVAWLDCSDAQEADQGADFVCALTRHALDGLIFV